MSDRGLTVREVQCIQLLAQGNEYREIGQILKISFFTVKGIMTGARLKLDAANSPAAVAQAMREGYIT